MPRIARPLRTMMRRLVFAPTIAAVLIVAGMTLLSMQLISLEIRRHQSQTISALVLYTDQYLNETSQVLELLALNLLDLAPPDQQRGLMHVRNQYPRLDSVYWLDQTGQVQLENTSTAALLGLDLSNEPYFYSARASRRVFFSPPYTSLDTQQLAITIAVPAYRRDQFYGVLVGELDLADLRTTLEALTMESGETAYIVDRSGTVIAHPDQDLVLTRTNFRNVPLVREMAPLRPGDAAGAALILQKMYYDPYQNSWVLGSAAHMTQGWVAVSTRPLSDILRPLLLLLLAASAAGGMGILLFSWQQRFLDRRISSPIANLAQQADRLSQGEFAADLLDLTDPAEAAPDAAWVEFTAHAGVEFSEMISLGQSFNRLIRAVRQRTLQLQRANQALGVELQERSEMEETVRCLNAELEQRVEDRTIQLQQTNHELEAFVYSVSHDLRAPLRAISGFSRILREDYANNLQAEGRSLIERILEATQRMNDLIEHLLRLSRLSQSQLYLNDVDLSNLVEQIACQIQDEDRSETGRSHQVEFICQPGLRCLADGHLLQAALDNLLRNAWKFTAQQDGPRVEFGSMLTPEGETAFYVRDNGAGFDMAQARRLFEPFQRLHTQQDFPGTGIGLATVRRIIHRHGGRIWAEAEPGQGAVFYFTLPARRLPIPAAGFSASD